MLMASLNAFSISLRGLFLMMLMSLPSCCMATTRNPCSAQKFPRYAPTLHDPPRPWLMMITGAVFMFGLLGW